MNNIRLLLAYDGTDYYGYQRQKQGKTVQSVLEDGIQELHQGRKINVYSAGRTDSGVHAMGQVVNFHSDIQSIKEQQWATAVNSFLPDDVRALKSDFVDLKFHSRFSAKSRIYRYYIYTAAQDNPFDYNRKLRLSYHPSLERLNEMAAILCGSHDFTSFTLERDPNEVKIRKIETSVFFKQGNSLVYEVEAGGFLWRMVRSIVGTILKCEKKGYDAGFFKELLLQKKRDRNICSAPAYGLYLYKVKY